MSYQRPDWESYFMTLALVAATRSTCLRRQVGAVIVRDGQIISTGYNGAPKGTPHCFETGCLRTKLGIPSGERHEICRGSHAEMNAIAQAASVGVSTAGASLYCTHSPCSFCTKAIINAGIRRVVYLYSYPDELAENLRREAGLVAEHFPPERLGCISDCLDRARLSLGDQKGAKEGCSCC
ncbi:cytidine/deoxycytidylate deaminase family protein [uncultured Pyramidobacter sp.]|uniref:deoxycytidylate deaminase n=1 Tax=uncultured Pyramidobacter sp. TaxID=1623495 RepID=UPI0025885854|nr:cytidine/deoxycytidylate deaminase family protein [uncultured Pyramidobacter sp.]